MTERTVTQAGRDKGRILLWLMILLSVLLLGFVTVFTVRHNPLYSDRDAYGISKYKFIEACKERLHEPAELSLNLQGQSVPLGQALTQANQLRQGERAVVETTATPTQIVQGVQEAAPGQLGLIVPVLIAAGNGEARRPLAQASMQCLYDRTTARANVTLGVQ